MKTLPILAAATILGLSSADAATFPLIVTDPAVEVSGSAVPAVNVFGSLLFGPATPDSITAITPVTNGLLLSIAAIIQPDLSFVPAGTELVIADGPGPWLEGDLLEVAYSADDAGDDTLHLLFDGIGGSAAGEFGTFAVATIIGEFGSAPFGSSGITSSGITSFGDVSVTVNRAALIPLPASLPLLAAGAGLLLALRRNRSGAVGTA